MSKSKDPDDWWKEGVDTENLPNYGNRAGQPWELPALAFFREKLRIGFEYDLEKIDPTRAMRVKTVVKGVPQLEIESGLFKKSSQSCAYLGPADRCRWCPEELIGDSAVDPGFFPGLFLGKSNEDDNLYVFILLVTYKPLEDFDGDSGKACA